MSNWNLIREVLAYYQPVVQLTAEGRSQLSRGELRRGRLRGITKDGHLSVRYFGTRTWRAYHPSFWEFSEQVDERKGDR